MFRKSLSSNIILGIVVVILIVTVCAVTAYALTIPDIDYELSKPISNDVKDTAEVVGSAAIKIPDGYVLSPIPSSILAAPQKEGYTNMIELQQVIQYYRDRMATAHNMAENARALGYAEDNIVIQWAQAEYKAAHKLVMQYQIDYDELVKQEKYAKYPESAFVWEYFHSKNYSDVVCAGILGNLMAETGGQTLAIQPLIKGNGYYGMAQWSMKYYPDVIDKSLEEQCDFLYNTIEKVFNTYGNNYKKNFNYSEFLALTDEKEAALAFAKCYERCGSGSYNVRKTNATKAYEYFVD